MNLYLLLALALGTVTAPTPVVRVPRASVVLRSSEVRALTRRFAAPSPAMRERAGVRATQRGIAFLRLDAPLTGAASPRAPAMSL